MDSSPLCKIDQFGIKRYYLNGELHRTDGPAIEQEDTKYKEWLQYGIHHRIGGPAIEYTDGTKIWYHHGIIHREDGAAIEHANGFKEYYIKGSKLDCLSDQEFFRLLNIKAFL